MNEDLSVLLSSQGKILTGKRNEISLYFPVQNSASLFLRMSIKARDTKRATEGGKEGRREGGKKEG